MQLSEIDRLKLENLELKKQQLAPYVKQYEQFHQQQIAMIRFIGKENKMNPDKVTYNAATNELTETKEEKKKIK